MPKQELDISPFDDFESASRAILTVLQQRLGFGLWMMTRTEGQHWIVLQAKDQYYDVREGTVFRWADSFCSQMVLGLGPRVAPRAEEIPVYAAAPIGRQVPIGAYIGVPVAKQDGTLFGTLCAIDPTPQRDSIRQELPMVELLARLLGTVLTYDLKAIEQARLLERSQKAALTDSLTGLLNRRGWDKQMAAEESRSRRYGSPVCVIIVDLDNLKVVNDTYGHAAGDELIRKTARCLRSVVRESDTLARIGGDEFALLGIECDEAGALALSLKLKSALADKGIAASLGGAVRDPHLGLVGAMAVADRAMYAAKAEKRGHLSLALA
jgi:diguanylate cyclase (GGDEF)-like protein